ncbi:MAG: hypothetical protein ACRC9L_01590 [Brevinema sp.]
MSERYGYPRDGGEWKTPDHFIILDSGCKIDKKPPGMTHLYENKLVYKDHPRIILRGYLDSFQTKIIESQLMLSDNPSLVDQLDNLLSFTREILGSEVLNEDVQITQVLGLTFQEIKERSHYPQKYYGMKQMVLPSYKDGKSVVLLNRLRAESREIELIATQTFRNNDTFERLDIIEALNCLSSAFHILMYQELSR